MSRRALIPSTALPNRLFRFLQALFCFFQGYNHAWPLLIPFPALFNLFMAKANEKVTKRNIQKHYEKVTKGNTKSLPT